MNKRLISRMLHEQVSGLKNSGVYFFRDNFEYILSGVVLEYVPRGVYIYDFWFPLYDFAGPNLTYSNRLHEKAFIGKGEMSEQDIVNHVISSPEAQNTFGTNEPISLSAFVEHILNLDGCFRNSHVRLIYAASLILLSQESDAATMLDETQAILHPSDVPHWKLLRDSLRQGCEVAQTLLNQIKEENLRMFGIGSVDSSHGKL